jgi:tetratricopeptide (TPR) repeat protein
MTGRRPQDPRTRPIRDDDANIPTLGPDPGATVAPDEQRDIETVDPSATVLPTGFAAPKPRSSLIESKAARAISELEGNRNAQVPVSSVRSSGIVRGGAATRVPGLDEPGEPPMTAEAVDELRAGLRAKAAAGEAKPKGKAPAASDVVPKGKVPFAETTEVPRTTAKPKKKGAWLAWMLAFVVLGGVGFAVAWFVMNPPGGAAVAEEVAAAPAEEVKEAAADASEAAEEVAAAAADASEEAAAEAQVAAVEVVAETADDVAVAAAEPVAEVVDPVAEVVDATVVAAVDVAVDSAVEPLVDAVVEKPETVVLVRNPVEATRLNEDGLAARKRGDHAAAMQLYKEALAQDQNHVWARYNYACELALAGQTKDALNELTFLHKLGTSDAKRALGAARKDSDFASIKDSGQFFRLTNF